MSLRLFTVGFAETSASHFFGLLRNAEVQRLIDVRLNNTSQLAGFTKKDDLPFFLREICGMDYEHLPTLAPTEQLLAAVRKGKRGWSGYEREFLTLMKARKVEKHVTRDQLDRAVLLCSEPTPEHCHRRLVAEYFRGKWRDVEIVHIV